MPPKAPRYSKVTRIFELVNFFSLDVCDFSRSGICKGQAKWKFPYLFFFRPQQSRCCWSVSAGVLGRLDMEASRATSNCSTAQQSFADLHTAGITSQMLENNGEAAPTGGAPDAKKRQADAEEALKREHQIEKEDDTDSNTIDSKREVETTFYNRMSVVNLIRERCSETISHDQATIPLAWQAMLTGLVDALLYTRFTVWTGFQTGEYLSLHIREESRFYR